MSNPDNDLPFNGLTLDQRAEAAVKQTTAGLKALVPFLVTLQPGHAPDLNRQRNAVKRALEALQDLLKTHLLDELFAAGIVHTFGPPPLDSAPDDAHNLRAIKEVHFILDCVAGIAPRSSIDAVRADLKRLENGEEPQVLRRAKYADHRSRDHTELADRAAAVLLVYYLAAKWQEKIADLLKRLGIGTGFYAFEKWAKVVPLQERKLMTAAGHLDREGGGLPLEQQALLSGMPRCLAVLNRHDAELFPDLAGLSDEDIVRKLFARVNRLGHFARSEPQKPPKQINSSGRPARKPQKRLKKTVRK